MFNTLTKQDSTITPKMVLQAATETADPVAIVNEAIALLADDPGAIYETTVIEALRAIRRKAEATYIRLCASAKGHKTRLDELTKPERDGRDENTQDHILGVARQHCKFHHDANGRGIAIINTTSHREIWFIDSSGFQDWLRSAYYCQQKQGIPETAMGTAIATLAALGKHEGDEQVVHMRCAKAGDAYFIDLCDDEWRVIRIDKKGWEIINRSPLLFTRTRNMRPLCKPASAGDLEKLWSHVNIPEPKRLLLLTWILECFRPDTAYSVLELCGEQGSAKSSSARNLRALIDPNGAPLRGRPKSVEDIYVAAANNYVVTFENISHLTGEQQDAICVLATGGGYATRQLYTNGDEHVMATKRPVLINGINPAATQPDLIERVISIECPIIPPEQRKDDQTLTAAWEAAYPSIFAGILDLFSVALCKLSDVKLDKKQRMADYQILGESIAMAQNHQPGDFSKIYDESVHEGADRSLETYGVAHALQLFTFSCRKKPWEGTFLTLFGELGNLGADRSNWPKSPKGLANQLKRLAPGLRRRGIIIEFLGHSRTGSLVKLSVTK